MAGGSKNVQISIRSLRNAFLTILVENFLIIKTSGKDHIQIFEMRKIRIRTRFS